jgi:hypothetical protein
MAFPTAPALSTLSPRGVRNEAYFPDCWGSSLTSNGLHIDKFESLGKNASISLPNPLLDPAVAKTLELTTGEIAKLKAGSGSANPTSVYSLYVGPGFSGPAKVTVLFAVGSEIIRHGLRVFFSSFPNRALVIVPGIEASSTLGSNLKRGWGIGVSKSNIDDLFTAAGLPGTAWTIDVIAGYSTGYRGIMGTINNFGVSPPTTLDLTHVKNVIIYDALYRGDEPAPGGNLLRALTTMDTLTGKTARLIIYEVTDGGTPRTAGDTRIPQATLAALYKGRYQLNNLKSQGVNLQALIYARMFDAAVQDGYFPASALPTALQNLIKALPGRGLAASTLPLAPFRPNFPAGAVDLASWAKANAADVAAFSSDAEPLRKAVIANPAFNLMGWGVPSVGDIMHDGFIPEFGWEWLGG